MITEERRQVYVSLFLAGRFIPKIQALADISDMCPVCGCMFESHPRNHHFTQEHVSMAAACVGCGAAIITRPIADRQLPEYVPCQDCFRGMSESDFPDRCVYMFEA